MGKGMMLSFSLKTHLSLFFQLRTTTYNINTTSHKGIHYFIQSLLPYVFVTTRERLHPLHSLPHSLLSRPSHLSLPSLLHRPPTFAGITFPAFTLNETIPVNPGCCPVCLPSWEDTRSGRERDAGGWRRGSGGERGKEEK